MSVHSQAPLLPLPSGAIEELAEAAGEEEQGRQLADQPFIAAGTVRERAPRYQLRPPMVKTISCRSCCSSAALIRESVAARILVLATLVRC